MAPKKKKTSNPRSRKPAVNAKSTESVQQPAEAQKSASTSQRNRKVVPEPPLNTRGSIRKQLQEQANATSTDDATGPADPAETAPEVGVVKVANTDKQRTSRRARPTKTGGSALGLSDEYEPVSTSRQQEVFRSGLHSDVQERQGGHNQPGTSGGDTATAVEATTTIVPPHGPTPANTLATSLPSPAPPDPSSTAIEATTVPPEAPNPRPSTPEVSTATSPVVAPRLPTAIQSPNRNNTEALPTPDPLHNAQSEAVPVPEPRDKGKGRAANDDSGDGEGTGVGDVIARNEDNEVDDDDIILNFLFGSAEEEEAEAEAENNASNKRKEGLPLKRGRLSNAAIKDIQLFGDKIRSAASKIAEKHSKDPSLILRVAGMGIRALRARNPYNDYHSWWSAKYHEQNEGVPLQDQNHQMTLDWEKFMEGVRPGDKEEIKRRMQPIYDETDAWKKDPTQSIPYTSSRVKAAIKQFTELAQAYSAAEGLEVGGVVAYIGSDARSKILSSFWGGSDLIQQAITKYEVNLNELMNVIVTILNALKYTNQGLEIEPPPIDIDPPSSDIEPVPGPNDDDKRDKVRQLLGYTMKAKLKDAAKKVGWKNPPSAFPWAHFLNHGYQRRICCTGWPIWKTTLGDPRGRNAFSREELDEIAAAHIKIIPWDSKYRKLTDAEAGDVPLLIDPFGKTIKTVRDSELWDKDMKALALKKLKRSQRRAAAHSKKATSDSRQGSSKGKRKSRNNDDSDVDVESGESDREPPTKRLRASHSRDATPDRNPSPSVIDVDSHDEGESQRDPQTTNSTSADPLVTALAQMLGALPREALQSMLSGVLTQPVAGPSRLPNSGSSKKGSKHGKDTHTDT